MASSLATNIDRYEFDRNHAAPSIGQSYTGPILPDDLRVELPNRIAALEAAEDVMANALELCRCLPIVKVPDSVYVDDGDIVLYWETSKGGNVVAVIDDQYMHYFVRRTEGDDVHDSNIEIGVNAGYLLRPYLPSHPGKSSNAVTRKNKR